MTISDNSTKQTDYCQKVVQLAMTDEQFRLALPKGLENAISGRRDKLGFDYKDLEEESRAVLAKLTIEELYILHTIFERAKRGGIVPFMF